MARLVEITNHHAVVKAFFRAIEYLSWANECGVLGPEIVQIFPFNNPPPSQVIRSSRVR